MKYSKFINHLPFFLLLVGSLLSFSTINWGILYSSKADCERFEGAGKCSECDGGWHSTAGCCLITDVKKGDVNAIKEYTAMLKKEYRHLKTEADKAKAAYDMIKKTKASNAVIEPTRKYAEETDRLATKAKVELNKFINLKRSNSSGSYSGRN